jgi:hypothetical protein
MQLRVGHREQDPAKDRPTTLRFIVSVSRGPELSKVRSINQLCGLRVTVEPYVEPKRPLQFKRCQRFYTRRVPANTLTGTSSVGAPTSPVNAPPLGESLSAVAAGATKLRTTVNV